MKKNGYYILCLFFTCLFLSGCGSNNLNSDKAANNSVNGTSTNSSKTEEKVYSESEKMTIKVAALFDKQQAYDTGSYIKGDVSPGEYAFIKFDGSGSYYCEKDLAGNIVDNENFDSFGYVKVHGVGNLDTRGVLVSISSFSELGVSGAKELYEIINDLPNYNQSGYYKVGVDIDPGNYVVESIGGSGYYAILTGPVSNSNIVDNDNFQGRAAIRVKNGQYVQVSGATITKQ